MENDDLNKAEQEAGERRVAWANVIIGAAILLFAYFSYAFFYDLEQRGSSTRIHWLAAFLYNMAGKWGVVGLFGIIGSVFIYMGVKRL
jgi:hypothetical protein